MAIRVRCASWLEAVEFLVAISGTSKPIPATCFWTSCKNLISTKGLQRAYDFHDEAEA